MNSTSTLNIAIAQLEPSNKNIQANIDKAIEIIDKLDDSVDLILFPEKYLTGYDLEFIKCDPSKNTFTVTDKRLEKLRDVCLSKKVIAIVGAPTFRNDKYFISSIIIPNNGGNLSFYDKIHLFENEKTFYTAGSSHYVLEVKNWRMGLAICNDVSKPEHAEKYKRKNVDIYLASCLFGIDNGIREINKWFPARAKDNNFYTVLSNSVGFSGKWKACGLSGIWDNLGHFMTKDKYTYEKVIIEKIQHKI